MRRSLSIPSGFETCGPFAWRRRTDGSIEVVHQLDHASISDASMIDGLAPLVSSGILGGQDEFEAAAIGVISTSAHTITSAWTAFYDNSIAELRSGRSPFSPIHQRARALVVGPNVLEVGCCFGFLALQLADDGHRVRACDISPGAVALVAQHSRRRGADVTASVGDATRLPYPSDSVDTVTLIHLLEHLDEEAAVEAIGEALRVSRRRVVVAVPFEDVPSEHFGHRLRLTASDLRRWADRVDHCGADVFEDHGGWLVLTSG